MRSTLPFIALLFVVLGCSKTDEPIRERMLLAGTWQFQLDTGSIGEQEQWYNQKLGDAIVLPGTTDSNEKGFLNTDTTTMHLNRQYTYAGAAWYQKEVTIPESFAGKHLELYFERTKPSKVWVDGELVGTSMLLQSPQQFELSKKLSPGVHTLTVLINNDLKLTPFGNVHIYSDDTQTNWNGILGDMYIEAKDRTFIADLQVFTDINQQQANVQLGLVNELEVSNATIELQLHLNLNGETTQLPTTVYEVALDSVITLTYDFEEVALWDEYEQPIYTVKAVLKGEGFSDEQSATFGMRDFTVSGSQFQINGRTTFLRGKHESAVFPLTGSAPMDVESWARVYRIAKSYGINHYRFHSYCPPEAAFIAADQEGIYLQAELPFWGGLDNDTTAQMLRNEGYGLLKAYGNHPSFVMFSPGNEIWGGHERVASNMKALKAYDGRPLYTMGSNNNIGYLPPQDYAEFFVGARIPDKGDTITGHTRLTHAFADAYHGGALNTLKPSTQINFNYAVAHMDLPIVSHEIGQYQIYPNYDEITKYTGNLKPWNLEVFQQRLQAKGMGDLDSVFQQASGAWSALCYKAEMEAAIRTKGMAGFQLLDLQDFPGQGTALVGILDAFMDSKGVVSPEVWKQSCNDVVLLAEFPKYTWSNLETFSAELVIANYSNKNLEQPVNWSLNDEAGQSLFTGSIESPTISHGGLTSLGEITIDLASVYQAQKLTLTILLEGTNFSNSYPIWVYPAADLPPVEDMVVTNSLSTEVMDQLTNGASVLLFPETEAIEDKSFAGHFPPEFWNYGMFKGISEWVKKPVSPGTLGLLLDPEHPIFADFPTDFHTNWQWYSIIKNSRSIILDDTPANYRPLVQVIDNLERNYKLGMLFEFKVGTGKLLICTAQLQDLLHEPEANYLYRSIVNYMQSEAFDPQQVMSKEELEKLL
ncbi:sugar-binding domain-containing protein [Marinoscillum pacificum]|uniref:sugar-binding domain-containing protein n=1 Tax=Marinoscillum pacificum TaxID=392723 RepID=UPI002157EB5D|nr:sugar-binding domain-containing protein [Marinoscillum pacificum]